MTLATVPARVFVLSSVALLLLSGCGAGTRTSSSSTAVQTQASSVDVDTPALRRAKRAAGVETCPTSPDRGRPVEDGLPQVRLPCLGGGPAVDVAALRGPLVVNLWAQWCGPCRGELPYYQRLHREADGRVRVLGIDYQDTQPMAALDLVRQTGVTYPLLADPEGQLRVPFRIRGLPGIVLVDRAGRVVHLEYTVIRSYGQLRSLVEEHLGVAV